MNSSYLFTISYAERELNCYVDRRDDRLTVRIGDDLQAELQIGPDGRLEQLSGHRLPESTLEFIKKQVQEDEQGKDTR